MLVKIEFEDYGQDFLSWVIDTEKERVVECEPFQVLRWVGQVVTQKEFKAGGRVTFIDSHGDSLTIQYPIKQVETTYDPAMTPADEINMLDKCRIDLAKAYKDVLNVLNANTIYDDSIDKIEVDNASYFEETMGALHNAILMICALEAPPSIVHVIDHPDVLFEYIERFELIDF